MIKINLSLKQQLEGMSLKEKAGHIWLYYKIHIFVTVALLAFLISLLNHFVFNPPRTPFLNISFYGSFVSFDTLDALQELVEPTMSPDINEYALETFAFYMTQDPTFNMAQHNRFSVMVMSQALDILIATDDYLDYLFEHRMAMDLHNFLTPQEFDMLDDMGLIVRGRVYLTEIGQVVGYIDDLPMGISLVNNEFFENLEPRFSSWYLLIIGNTQRHDLIREFLQKAEIL